MTKTYSFRVKKTSCSKCFEFRIEDDLGTVIKRGEGGFLNRDEAAAYARTVISNLPRN